MTGRGFIVVEGLKQLYRYRALVQILILRELKARYRGTFLGFLWSFVNPLILMATYVVVFSVYFRIDMENYPVFLLCGILPWAWFSSSLSEATHSIISNGGLIKKVYLPSEIFPLVYVGSNMFHYLLSVPILLFFLILFKVKLSGVFLSFPLILCIQFLLTYGLVLILSSLAVQFRDLFHIVPNLLMIWFFITPIFYPITMVPEKYRFLVNLNPMTYLMTAYQDIFFFNRLPSGPGLMVMVGLSFVLLMIGLSFFETRKDLFAEEV
jgi:ABC-type polysaccharide/polyol phosphate export permease